MAGPFLRFQYPGAVYHAMARGDGGKTVFEIDDEPKPFLSRRDETSAVQARVRSQLLVDLRDGVTQPTKWRSERRYTIGFGDGVTCPEK